MYEMFQCMLVLVSRKLPVSRQLQHRLHMSSLIIESQTVEMFESPNPIISVFSESEINFRKLKLFFAIIFIQYNRDSVMLKSIGILIPFQCQVNVCLKFEWKKICKYKSIKVIII